MAEPQWVLVVTAYVDPSVEADWNKWYDEVHVPEIQACPGVHRAMRCETAEPATVRGFAERPEEQRRGYIAIYDIDGPQVLQTPEFAKARGWRQFADKVKSVTRVYRKRGIFPR
jgi:hypothetical protein